MDEQSLIKIYVDLTGASESRARGVLMYVVQEASQTMEGANGTAIEPAKLRESIRAQASRTSRHCVENAQRTRILLEPSRAAATFGAS
jgi:hypothetical protein